MLPLRRVWRWHLQLEFMDPFLEIPCRWLEKFGDYELQKQLKLVEEQENDPVDCKEVE